MSPVNTQILTTDSVAVLKEFARATMGCTFLSYFVVSKEVKDGHLKAIPIENKLLASGEAHIVTRLGVIYPKAQILATFKNMDEVFVNHC